MQIYDFQKNKKKIVILPFNSSGNTSKLSYIRKYLIQELYFKIIRMICDKTDPIFSE